MKTVGIRGPGCKRCDATVMMVRDAAARLGVDVIFDKITDAKSIAIAGVMSTSGIAVDGKRVHAGGLPDVAKPEGSLSAWS